MQKRTSRDAWIGPILGVFVFLLFTSGMHAQELPAPRSLGVSSTFAPTSSHILIGDSEQRRTWTVGIQYDNRIWHKGDLSLAYEGSITPFFQERDPTITATYSINAGYFSTSPSSGQRVVYVNNNPVGTAGGFGGMSLVYPIYGSTKSYGFAVSPLGARVDAFTSHRIQPTFSLDLGVVFSPRDVPVDDSASFNYLFSFGPGLRLIGENGSSINLEYLYRHMSNANAGATNPGVDQGVIRLTLSHSLP